MTDYTVSFPKIKYLAELKRRQKNKEKIKWQKSLLARGRNYLYILRAAIHYYFPKIKYLPQTFAHCKHQAKTVRV